MMKIRNYLVLLAAGIMMAVGCSSRGPQPVAVVPPPPPPPLPAPPAVTQPIPLRPLPVRSVLGMMPEPRFDPAEDVILAAQAAFERGEKNYHTGHLEMAKQEFNDAIAAILLAQPSLREDKRLQKAFDALVDRIHAYELEALKQGDGFAESTYQP